MSFLFHSSNSDQPEAPSLKAAVVRLRPHPRFLPLARLYRYIRLRGDQRPLHAQLPAETRRAVVPRHHPLLSQPLPGVYALDKLSHHRHHVAEQPQDVISHRRYGNYINGLKDGT